MSPSYKLHVNGTAATYEYKKSDFPEIAFKDGKQYGVIAQEIEKIMPEIVSTDAEGYKSVAYTDIIPVLIESIKAQQAMIEQLKLEVEN